jgi:hypothetical protein
MTALGTLADNLHGALDASISEHCAGRETAEGVRNP